MVGCLRLLFLTYAPVDINGPLLQHNDEVTKCMGELLWTLVLAAETCHMDLGDCILKKNSAEWKKIPRGAR